MLAKRPSSSIASATLASCWECFCSSKHSTRWTLRQFSRLLPIPPGAMKVGANSAPSPLHAFFKGLLFLAAGSVIHAMGGEQDMQKMGGLKSKIKYTYATMLIATLAIAGIPPLAGFFSKDAILFGAFQIPGGHPLYALGLLTALLTSVYMFRLIFLTFHGKQRYDE